MNMLLARLNGESRGAWGGLCTRIEQQQDGTNGTGAGRHGWMRRAGHRSVKGVILARFRNMLGAPRRVCAIATSETRRRKISKEKRQRRLLQTSEEYHDGGKICR